MYLGHMPCIYSILNVVSSLDTHLHLPNSSLSDNFVPGLTFPLTNLEVSGLSSAPHIFPSSTTKSCLLRLQY